MTTPDLPPWQPPCPVCGGRPAACAALGHRSESDRNVKWQQDKPPQPDQLPLLPFKILPRYMRDTEGGKEALTKFARAAIEHYKASLPESRDSTRLRWLHTNNCDSEGWEYGVAQVKFGTDGLVEEFLWTLSDSSDIDKLIGFPVEASLKVPADENAEIEKIRGSMAYRSIQSLRARVAELEALHHEVNGPNRYKIVGNALQELQELRTENAQLRANSKHKTQLPE